MVTLSKTALFILIITLITSFALSPAAQKNDTVFFYSHGLGEMVVSDDAHLYQKLMGLTGASLAIPAYDDGGIKISQLSRIRKLK
jgi:hypothetical protein